MWCNLKGNGWFESYLFFKRAFRKFFPKGAILRQCVTGQIQGIAQQNGAHKPNQESTTEVLVVEKVEQLASFKVRGVSNRAGPLHTEGGG